jgi:MtN3 and saliva related transmembrane protein
VSPFPINAIGVGAALCSMSSFLPQAAKIIREKAASGMSVRMCLVSVTGFAPWAAYALGLKSWPLIAANPISFSLCVLILKV